MKILAVSGGIDSVVMLHYLKDDPEILVAHFDHGIRSNSHEDCEFVQKLADQYGLQFVSERQELGEQCSEALARQKRYEFLQKLAQKHHGQICVAHHADDALESIAINYLRGTGWRGLAPMQNAEILRPLLTWTKADIYRYATEHNLSFRQDQSNTEGDYLRNRVREALRFADAQQKQQLLKLYENQCAIKTEIDAILASIPTQLRYSRMLADEDCAPEILRELLARQNILLTRPQLKACQEAIRNFQPGKRFSLDRDHFLQIDKYSFSVC